VTPKTVQEGRGAWKLVTPQIAVSVLLVVASVVGIARLLAGVGDPIGTAVNLLWVAFDLAVLSVIVPALQYRGFAATVHRPGGTPSGGTAESVTATRREGGS
jgi:cellulose synthase (UDP-forming)